MNTPTAHAHIITHTHWDREWFLTSVYTSQWIAGLIDRIEELVAANPDFQFLFDGQTLVIEDLLANAPYYRERTQHLIEQGNLLNGPYYCQPDWQMTSGEALIRNLQYGFEDIKRLDGQPSNTGWLVDTFGHISQAPQIHQLFGINAVFVWRGVPEMAPYFRWEGSDGQTILGIDLFGGYRNLYGITHAPEIATQRLVAEVEKLHPYYPTPDIPFFDGYDLEDNPEDTVSFYTQHAADLPPTIQVQASTPQKFSQTIRQKDVSLPLISGELNSGKYGATFPGTFSARVYLKVLARDCTHLLYQVCEPLATMAHIKGRRYDTDQYERWSRILLHNAVHDCICGVSIDQVHEKMEFTYRQVFDGMQADVNQSVGYIMRDFAPGMYAVSTNPFLSDTWQFVGDTGYRVKTQGVGVWPIAQTCTVDIPNTLVEAFQWSNDHYTARISTDGSLQMGEAVLGRLIVWAEHGDTYSDERGELLGDCQMTATPIIEQQSEVHCIVYYPCSFEASNTTITAGIRLYFDQSPLVRWMVDLDSQGTNFRVDIVFETNLHGPIFAGMPFDMVQRSAVDNDLLPREVEPPLGKILLGQREIGEVRTFPFHDFVNMTGEAEVAMVLAKGVYAYQAQDNGQVAVTLRRSVEWLTKADLEYRVGDAGPFFYVPDARCERLVRHELAVAIGNFDSQSQQQLNATFQNPPQIVEVHTTGEQTEWCVFQENSPLSSLQILDGRLLARVWNPTDVPVKLHQPLQATNVWGQSVGPIETLEPRTINTLLVEHSRPNDTPDSMEPVIPLSHDFHWRVGSNHGTPERAIIDKLATMIDDLKVQIGNLETELSHAIANQRYRIEHQLYARKRELYEYMLSVRLNELKLATGGHITQAYLFEPDAQVAEIGLKLNRLRIKRRIYDYIVESI